MGRAYRVVDGPVILSEMWDATEPRPVWQRAVDSLPTERVEFVAAVVALSYVMFTALVLLWTVRP